MKKKAIKIAAASAVAASAFVATAPLQSNAASNVVTTVDQAVMQMQKAYHTYGDVTATGDFADINAVYKQYNVAKAAYANAKAIVIKAGGTQKDVYLAKLDSNYKTYLTDRVVPYIDAYNYAVQNLQANQEALQTAIDAKNMADVQKYYNEISYQLKVRTVILDRVYGQSTRELLRSSFKADAQALRDAMQFDVTVAAKVNAVNDAIAAGKLDVAKAAVDQINKFLPSVTATFKADLTAKATAAVAAYNATQTTTVEKVSAIDGKTIEVKFSAAVDAKTLKDSNNLDVITLVDAQGANVAATQELSEDGKTLTLTSNTFFKGDYTVKVPFEVVKGTNGKYLSAVNQGVTVNDTAAPVLSSVKATVKSTTEKVATATLTFNEDVASIEVVKVNGVNYTPVVTGKTATITGLALDATKSYDVTVVNATDAAGNTKDVQTAPLTVSVDNVQPTITSVEATGENTVKVTLNKAVVGNTLAVSGKIGTFTADVVQSAVVNPKNDKEYTVTLKSDYLFKNGNADLVTLNVAKEALADSLGNKNDAELTKTVTVSKDVVAPAVSSVTTKVENGKVTAFTVNFAEEVTSLDASKVYVVNSKGEILNLTDIATPAINADNTKQVVFTFGAAVAVDKYSFDLQEGFVTDGSLAANKNAKYSFTVDVTDAAKPVQTSFTIASVTPVLNTANAFIVDFGTGVKVKATGTGSALNPVAYSVNGVSLPSDAKVEFVSNAGVVDQTKVVVTLPEGFVKASDDKAVFGVNGVQTLDNKTSNPFIQTVAVVDNAAPVAQSFVATDLGTITVTYSESLVALADLDGAKVSDEVKLYDAKGASVAITASSVGTDGKLVLTVADSSAVAKLTTVAATGAADVIDLANNAEKAGITINK